MGCQSDLSKRTLWGAKERKLNVLPYETGISKGASSLVVMVLVHLRRPGQDKEPVLPTGEQSGGGIASGTQCLQGTRRGFVRNKQR